MGSIILAVLLQVLSVVSSTTTCIDYGQLKLWLMTETIVRITYQPKGAGDLPLKYYQAVPSPADWPAVAYTEESSSGGDDLRVITTAGMSISVNTTSWLCAFTDLATGEEVLRGLEGRPAV